MTRISYLDFSADEPERALRLPTENIPIPIAPVISANN